MSNAVTSEATATKLSAMPSPVALRKAMPTATVHTHTTTPVGISAVGRRQPRLTSQPNSVPAKNGQAVSAIPAMLTPSA